MPLIGHRRHTTTARRHSHSHQPQPLRTYEAPTPAHTTADPVQRAAVQVRGGDAGYRRRGRARGGASSTCRPLASTGSRPTSTTCSSTRTGAAGAGRPACGSSGPRRREGRDPLVPSSTRCTRTTSAPSSTRTASRSARGHHCCQPLMRAAGRGGDGPRIARLLQHLRRARRARGGPRAGAGGVRLMADLRDSTRKSSWTTTSGRATSSALEGANRTAEGYNPLCGDRLTVSSSTSRTASSATSSSSAPGCAISKASASMMTDSVKGKTCEEAERCSRSSTGWSRSGATTASRCANLGKLSVLRRRPRVPRARQVREPRLAHAARGAGRPVVVGRVAHTPRPPQ